MMWSKTIIVDKSIKRLARRGNVNSARQFSYGFGGYDEGNMPTWHIQPENLKLYDNVADAVSDAKKLCEELPIDVLTITIDSQQGRVDIITVKF